MDNTIVVAILSLVGTLAGTFGGVMTSNRLTGYRLEKLEEQMKKYNNLIERTFRLEEANALQSQSIESLTRRVDKLEK